MFTAECSMPLLIAGLALALGGWMLYWGGVIALGGLLGASLGSGAGLLIAKIAGWSGGSQAAAVLAAAVVGAAAGVFFLRLAHYLLFFLCGVVVGSLAAHYALHYFQSFDYEFVRSAAGEILIRALGALAGGAALVWLNRYIVIILSSTLGTLLLVLAWPAPALVLGAPLCWILSIAAQSLIARRLNLFHRDRGAAKSES